MRSAEPVRFLRVQRGMDSTEYYIGPAAPRGFTDFVAAQSIPRVYSDAHNISGVNPVKVNRI
jgi:hypothetical protein